MVAWSKRSLTLQWEKKKKKKRTGLEVGDVVRTIPQVLPKAHWPLARLTEMYLGQDQHVRVVKVQIGKTSFLQPISNCLTNRIFQIVVAMINWNFFYVKK